VIAATAAVLECLSAAIETTTQANYLKPHSTQTAPPAAGAARSSGTLTVLRVGDVGGPIQLLAGDLLRVFYSGPDGELALGPQIRLAEDLLIPGGAGGEFTVDAEAVRPGYAGNVPEGRLVLFVERGRANVPGVTSSGNTLTDSGLPDRFTPEMLGRFVRFTSGPNATTFARRITGAGDGTVTVDGPVLVASVGGNEVEVVELNDLGLSVSTATALEDGTSPWLDFIASERGTGRVDGESDLQLCDRAFYLADVVSPGAILRAVSRILTPAGIGFELKEVRVDFQGFTWDVSFYDTEDANFDDNRWLSGVCSYNRYFQVCLTSGLDQGDTGMFYDTGAAPEGFYDNGAWDGQPWTTNAALAALRSQLQKVRAQGVCFDFVRG